MTHRLSIIGAIAFLLAAAGQGRAQPPVDAIVAKVEPSVACVIVSRSGEYRRIGLATGKEDKGQLGSFNARMLDRIDEARLGIGPEDSPADRAAKIRVLRRKLDLADPHHNPEAFGTGLVVSAEGLILTSYHVVQDATKIYVRLPGDGKDGPRGGYADIHAADPRSDLAVLRLIDDDARGFVRGLTPIPFGNADTVKRGQSVIALTNPFAAGANDGSPSVSLGVISNLHRRVPGRQPVAETNANPLYQHGILMQTDARLALGSSGGALLNTQGECIGITTALAALAGGDAPGGFALPVNSAIRKIIEVLKKGEEVEYGYLGVSIEEQPAAVGGVIVTDAQDGSPAQRDLGLRKGDVITAIGDRPVRDTSDLMLNLGLHLVGEKVPITFQRLGIGGIGREQKADALLVKYHVIGKKIASSLGSRPYVDGLRVDYTSLLAQKPFPPGGRISPGVLVTDVQPASKAARLQINPEDIILEVAGRPVNTPAAFYDALQNLPANSELTIRHGTRTERVRW